MKKYIFTLLSLLTLVACKPASEEDGGTITITKYIGCDKVTEGRGECIRWMDRNIYMAYSSATNSNRNNEFQKAKVKDALNDIAKNTMLGEGYFKYTEIDESQLNPILESGLNSNEYKSFILIWDDASFNDFIVNQLGGQVPDTNAVAVINSAYKRKFYIIFRASCFNSSATCNSITTNGINALVSRQLGLLIGLSPKNCNGNLDPLCSQDVMYTTLPTDVQWADTNKNRFFASLNGMLEIIYNNPNYYDEYVPTTN